MRIIRLVLKLCVGLIVIALLALFLALITVFVRAYICDHTPCAVDGCVREQAVPSGRRCRCACGAQICAFEVNS